LTLYDEEHLLTDQPVENPPARHTDGHDQPWANLNIAATSTRYRADKIAREQTSRPANAELAVAHVDSPPIHSSLALKAAPTTSSKSP
jgi:hypothetical protein